jgi:outer membrane protein TolC
MVVATVVILAFSYQTAFGQSKDAEKKVFSLEEAVDFALQHYPAVRASVEQLSAARAGVVLARTNYLPRADMLWQGNRATHNNIFGLLLPQSVVSSITGPVLPTTSNDSVWGSAACLLVSWEPFDFGRRAAMVSATRAGQNVANSELSITRLDVAVAVTNAFFTVVAAQQRVTAAQANVDRRQTFTTSVHTLVKNDLRPGADSSRADAEFARAQVLLIQAQQGEAVSRAALAQMLGIAGNEISIETGSLLSAPPVSSPASQSLSSHPVATVEQARIDEIRAREHILERSWYPRFNLQSTVFGRGSGANGDGTTQTGATGLNLQRENWATGLTVTFPLFDIFSNRAQKQIERGNEGAERARYDQTLNNLTGQIQQAQATLESARLVAEKTPVELQAARDAETQARARYDAGLTNIVEITEAQSLLIQAEIDDSLARLAVWNDIASLTAAQGDLQPFLQFLHQKTQGGP